jgi:hypothetical protein
MVASLRVGVSVGGAEGGSAVSPAVDMVWWLMLLRSMF